MRIQLAVCCGAALVAVIAVSVPVVPVLAQEAPPEERAHPYDGLSNRAFWQAVERDRISPTEMPGATGSFQYPSPHGPFRNDPQQGVPEHAYSPFDREEVHCPSNSCDYEPGVLLVRFKEGVSVSQQRGAAPSFSSDALNEAFSELPVREVRRVFPQAQPPAPGARVTRPDGKEVPVPDLTRWHRIELDAETSRGGPPREVQGLVRELRTLEDLDYAEPEYQYRSLGQPEKGSEPERAGSFELTAAAGDFFSDPDIGQQWHLEASKVPAAWQHLADEGLPAGGDSDIIVAVIDTGVDYNHPDLAGSMWVNQAEFNGTAGQDSDGNGYVDDVHGARVIAGDLSGDPQDDHGHGTHVAGIIAAQGNNNEGGVGVAPNVQIMAIKAAQYSGVLNASDIARGIEYAMDNGADVINMSFGGYARSQVIEDALANAFGHAVLVAAAGNDGRPNLSCSPLVFPLRANLYPGSFNWVLGVKAHDASNQLAGYSNFDCQPEDASEYELAAPGSGIYSTLPFEGYGSWSGTSMATPLVAGMAALARTKWSDKAVYSSRFIMGQLAATGPALSFVRNDASFTTREADAEQALVSVPQPKLSYLEHWLFDTEALDPANDADGIVDAGETVDLAVVLRNHWGKAENVTVKLEAWAEGAVGPDPYVTMIDDTVNYGAIGSFNNDDNGLIYDEDGAVTGVEAPFRFSVSSSAPNDHLIPFKLTMTADNGFDASAPAVVTTSRFYLLVQRGRELPRLISADMTLTKDDYWLVPDSVLIEEGATVTVTEGTQIQFFSVDPDDPYADQARPQIQVEGSLLIEGTAQEPVEVFTGLLYPEYPIQIRQMAGGEVRMSYARLMNPAVGSSDIYGSGGEHAPLSDINHAYFSQTVRDCIRNYYSDAWQSCALNPLVSARRISDSRVRELGLLRDGVRLLNSPLSSVLLDSVYLYPWDIGQVQDSVFLKNYRTFVNWDGSVQYATSEVRSLMHFHGPSFLQWALPEVYDGNTYVAVASPGRYVGSINALPFFDAVERFAQSLGGHIVSITSQAENDFLTSYSSSTLTSENFSNSHSNMDCGHDSLLDVGSCWELFSGWPHIGLIDRHQTGLYEWTSGEDVSFSNWHSRIGSGPFVEFFGSWRREDLLSPTQPFIIEIPGEVTAAELNAARESFIASSGYQQLYQNAFLNDWLDPDIEHWLRFHMGGDRDHIASLANNYWGTESTTLIEKAIVDFDDDFNLGVVDYEPILTAAPETAYPFVVDVQWETADGSTSEVGAETVDFIVTFNRDMDTSVDPMVSFGPDEPYTDFIVSGDWQDPRTWRGQFEVTPVTGDGWQYMRVVDAVAADDPWLVTGNDFGRFRFEVITSGTEAMSLQASGGEGVVDLWWGQDDFETLAGYHLYRATSPDGSYERINETVIPQGMTTWSDSDVVPGQPYYYKFTVVKTDLSESDFSNTATATPLDTIAPSVNYTPVTSAAAGQPLTIRADAKDNVAVQSVTLFHRGLNSGDGYQSREMAWVSDDRYSATLEGSVIQPPGIEYYVEVSDGINQARSTSPTAPHEVTVDDKPLVTAISPTTGPAAGGTAVTISGSNFQEGVSAKVGDGVCTDLVRENSTTLHCTSSPSIPDVVDVRVSNPSGEPGILAQAFTFQSDTVFLGLPDIEVGLAQSVQIPLNAADVSGLVSASFTVQFDSTVLQATGASLGNLSPGWSLASNIDNPGSLVVSMASGGGSVSGSGVLSILEFDVVGSPDASTALTITSSQLNGGAIDVSIQNGTATVERVYDIGGSVQYWSDGRAVPSTEMTLTGDATSVSQSDGDGTYALTAPFGDYAVTPSRSQAEDGISALDASLVLRHDVGLETLTGDALAAADVNRDGQVEAYDAFLILRHAVGLSPLPFNGAERVWLFTPETRNFSGLAADQVSQDFTGILLGDPTGNWSGAAIRTLLSRGQMDVQLQVEDGFVEPSEILTVPVVVNEAVADFYSLEIELSYNPAVFEFSSVDTGALAEAWSLAVNDQEAGTLNIAIAGTSPITGAGHLLDLSFWAVGSLGDSSALSETTLEIDEGALNGSLESGMLRIDKAADLAIEKRSGSFFTQPGGALTYELFASNQGPSDVVDARIEDVAPPRLTFSNWQCEPTGGALCESAMGSGSVDVLVTIPKGDAVTISVDASLTDSDPIPFTNTATITAPADVTELLPANNVDTDTDAVGMFIDSFESVEPD